MVRKGSGMQCHVGHDGRLATNVDSHPDAAGRKPALSEVEGDLARIGPVRPARDPSLRSDDVSMGLAES